MSFLRSVRGVCAVIALAVASMIASVAFASHDLSAASVAAACLRR